MTRQAAPRLAGARRLSGKGTAASPAARTVTAAPEPKLSPPEVRPGAPVHAGALRRLAASQAQLVTLAAPAGYGKSTLLRQWADADPRPFAWLRLAEEESDRRRLTAFISAAVERALGAPLPGIYRALQRAPASDALTALGQGVAAIPQPLVLVLDDVHAAGGDDVTAVLSVLLESLPAGCQLVLSGRTTPPLDVARVRAEGRLLELEHDDLALSRSEARALARHAGVRMSAPEAAELHRRTEGWPAGLYLAALSISRGPGRAGFDQVEADRFIADYLRSQVLSGLSDDDVSFVTRSSVLDRISGPICDALLERTGSAETLERLEREGVFLVALDHSRHWYRYHAAFRSLLAAELERNEPGAAAALHRRAADWYVARDLAEQAIHHAQLAGDLDRSGALVERVAMRAYNRGRVATVEGWLDLLEQDGQLHGRPGLAVLAGWVHALRGRPERADHCADVAARGLAESGGGADETTGPRLSLLSAALCRDGAERMRTDAGAAVAAFPPGSPWRAKALFVLGWAQLLAGEHGAADRLMAEAAESAGQSTTNTAAMALAGRSLLASWAGDCDHASALAREATAELGAVPLPPRATSAICHAAAARAALDRNDPATAREQLTAAARLLPQLTYALPWLAVAARAELARAALALGERDAASALLAEIRGILARRPHLGALAGRVHELELRLEGAADGWEGTLTAAELRLLPLLTTHLSFREIAAELYVSRNTVKTQAISSYRKLGVTSRSEAVERAAEIGLIDRPRLPPEPAARG